MNSKELGLILKERRRFLGLNQQELADLAEVNINTIVSIEKDEGNPKIKTVIRICNVLGVELSVK